MHEESSMISLLTSRHVLKIYLSQMHNPAAVASQGGWASQHIHGQATGNKLSCLFSDLHWYDEAVGNRCNLSDLK